MNEFHSCATSIWYMSKKLLRICHTSISPFYSTISLDMKFLRQQAKESMKEHLEHKLPLEFTHCIQGINEVLRMSFEIANSYAIIDNEDNGRILSTDENRTRLQALALANDCYKYKMDLVTNGVVITDAIKFVQQKKEELSTPTTKDKENTHE